jgi:hypothetical protein
MPAIFDSDNPYGSPHIIGDRFATRPAAPDRRRAAKMGFVGMMLGCAVAAASGALGAVTLGVVAVSFAAPDPNSLRPPAGSILFVGGVLGAACAVPLGAILGTAVGVCIGWDRALYPVLRRWLFGLLAAFCGAVIGSLAGELVFFVLSLPEATGVPYGVAIGAVSGGVGAALTDFVLDRRARNQLSTQGEFEP